MSLHMAPTEPAASTTVPRRFIAGAVALLCLFAFLALPGCRKESSQEKFQRLRAKYEEYRKEDKLEEARISLLAALEANPNDANSYYDLAETLIRLKHFGKAVEAYQSALNIDPGMRDARLHLAALFVAARQREAAESQIQKLLEQNPKDTEALVLSANIATLRSDFQTAGKILQVALQNDPNNIPAIASMADVANAQGDTKKAEELFLKALAVDPNNSPVRLALSDIYIRESRLDEAQQILEGLVKSNPKNPDLRFFFGDFLMKRGMQDRAFEQYQELVKTDPLRIESRDRLYDMYLVRRDRAAAEGLTKSLEGLAADNPGLKYFQGRDLELQGELQRALQLYTSSFEALPKFAPVFRRAGLIELALGRKPEGLEHLNQAVTLDPADSAARIALAQNFFSKGDLAQATANVNKVLEVYPRQIGANVIRADIALVEGNVEGARKVYAALIQTFPNNPVGYSKMGLLEEKAKNQPAAIENYKKAISLDVADKSFVAGRRLAQVLVTHQGVNEAIEQFKQLHQTNKNSRPELSVILGSLILSKPSPAQADFSQARELFESAIKDKPDLVAAYLALAALDARGGDFQAAAENYTKMIGLDPKAVSYRMLLALAYERQRKYQEAGKVYDETLEISPRFGPAANNLAWLLVDKLNGDLDRALKLALIGKEELPNEPGAADTLGWVYFKKGSTRAALPFLEEAVELERGPNKDQRPNPEILYHLGVVQKQLEDKEGARKSLQEALAGAGEGTPLAGQIKEALAQ